MIAATTRLVGLIGWPVKGSLSPRMQNAAFAARGLDWAYVALPVEPDEGKLADALRGVAAAGFAGVNVTTPYKQQVIEACDGVDDTVAASGSANTLVFRDGRISAFSTDAEVLADFDAPTAAVVGNGGAARAFAAALEARGTAVRVYSRSGDWPPAGAAEAELLVHATPVVDELVVEPRPGQIVVDLPYRVDGRRTALAAAAQAAECRLIDGFEVLVRQGAAAFELWTGIAAPLAAMRASLRPYASRG
jgi:shikimate dehydrogenase